MAYIGFILSILIGVILGLIGGGGAILTVPLVSHFFHVSTMEATTYSLIVVTFSSLMGVWKRRGQGLLDLKHAVLFLIPSMLTAFYLRSFVVHKLPADFIWQGRIWDTDGFMKLLLSFVMLLVALSMLRPMKIRPNRRGTTPILRIILLGLFTGTLSGVLGAGGGFIIVPILMTLGYDMRKAVANSMFIIVIQSTISLMGDFAANWEVINVNWYLAGTLTLLTMVGVIIGTHYQYKITGKILRRIFSGILFSVALFVGYNAIKILF